MRSSTSQSSILLLAASLSCVLSSVNLPSLELVGFEPLATTNNGAANAKDAPIPKKDAPIPKDAPASKGAPDLKAAWQLYYECDTIQLMPMLAKAIATQKNKAEWIEITALTEMFGESAHAVEDAAVAAKLESKNPHIQGTYALVLSNFPEASGRNLKNAMAVVTNALKLDPKNGRNVAIYAHCLYKYGRNKEAMRKFAEAIKINPADFDVNKISGDFYQDMMDEDSAKASYERMVKFTPSARSFFMRSTFRRRHDDANGALEDLTTCLNTARTKQCWYYLRGSLLSEMRQYERAIKDFDAAEKLGWGFEVWYSRAKCYAALKQFDKAERDMANTLKRMTVGLKEDTFQANEAALVKRDRYLELWALRAEYAEKAGNYAKALKLNETILKARPDSMRARLQHAHCLAALNKNKEALAEFDKLIKVHPDIASLYKERSEVLTKLGRTAEAQADKKRADSMLKETGM